MGQTSLISVQGKKEKTASKKTVKRFTVLI